MNRFIIRGAASALFLLSLILTGCANPAAGSPDQTSTPVLLYLTDGASGKIYTYNPATTTVSSQALLSIGKKASGEISFHGGKGYVAVGGGAGGLFWFDPAATVPSATQIGGACSAQYLAFASDTKAYLSVADYSNPAGNGIYRFDPSHPENGLSPLAPTIGATKYPQEITLGSDGMLYAANNDLLGGSASVSRIDPATDTLSATISTQSGGTTGLCAGTYNGKAGVFVANTAGSLDFVANDAANASTAQLVSNSGLYPMRLAQLSNGNLVATGFDPAYANHSWLIALSGSNATVSELKYKDAAFGGSDIAVRDNLVYIAAGDYATKQSRLFVLDLNASPLGYSPLSVMKDGVDLLADIGFNQ